MITQKHFVARFNWSLLVTALLLSGIGLANLYSASLGFGGGEAYYFKAQSLWLVLSIAGCFVTMLVHFRYFQPLAVLIYLLSLVLLVMVLVVGEQVAGHQSWLKLGSLTLQPTEMSKIGVLFILAARLCKKMPGQKLHFVDLLPLLFLVGIPMGLVIYQGDLGSSLFFGLLFLSLIVIHGVDWKMMAVLGMVAALIGILAYFFFLLPHQKDRIQSFLHPGKDPRGAGYHLIQSKIAVGSGGLVGKGFLKGQTHKLKFIPERHTDFIFPVLAEEWGFAGSLTVLLLYFIFILTGINIALKAPNRFIFYLLAGVVALIFWHVVINLGGVLGLMPLTGVPLPFLSYGGSSLAVCWLAVGILLNVSLRRFMF